MLGKKHLNALGIFVSSRICLKVAPNVSKSNKLVRKIRKNNRNKINYNLKFARKLQNYEHSLDECEGNSDNNFPI
jgi:hypothetical protein